MTANYPTLIETLDYEALLADKIRRARQIPGWTAELESDPVLKLLEISAYDEMVLRADINHKAISNLVAFAGGTDLDACAAFYQLTRLDGEPDTRFRRRLFAHIAAMAGNGTAQSYIAKALGAHIAVIDVVAYRQAPGKVNVAVWGSDDALDAVRRTFGDDNTMLGIDVSVYAATVSPVAVHATVTVGAASPTNIADILSRQLRDSADNYRGFGRILSPSKITAWLDHNDVNKVALHAPTQDITPQNDALWRIGNITIEVVYD